MFTCNICFVWIVNFDFQCTCKPAVQVNRPALYRKKKLWHWFCTKEAIIFAWCQYDCHPNGFLVELNGQHRGLFFSWPKFLCISMDKKCTHLESLDIPLPSVNKRDEKIEHGWKGRTGPRKRSKRWRSRNIPPLQLCRAWVPSMLNPGKGFPFFVTPQKIRLR